MRNKSKEEKELCESLAHFDDKLILICSSMGDSNRYQLVSQAVVENGSRRQFQLVVAVKCYHSDPKRVPLPLSED